MRVKANLVGLWGSADKRALPLIPMSLVLIYRRAL